jgi:hypothetical protein
MFSRISTRSVLLAAALPLAMATTAFAQTAQTAMPRLTAPVSLSGPRFGVTFLNQATLDTLAEHEVEVGPMITQFGWQFEKRAYGASEGLSVLNEWIFLLGGLDQGVALPSVTWMVGLRTKEGAEVGIGPNLTPLGFGLALAAGTTFRAGALNVPVNVAIVPSKAGVRVSVLTGFNTRR